MNAKSQHRLRRGKEKLLCILAGAGMLFTGCKGNVTGPPFLPGNYQICYCGYGQIKINNILGTDPVSISLQDPDFKRAVIAPPPSEKANASCIFIRWCL